jgi:putative transposase
MIITAVYSRRVYITQATLFLQHERLNAYAERWVRSVKEECLSKVILFGERSLRRALNDYVDHFHAERNRQGKGNILLLPRNTDRGREGPVRCRERLGGLLRYYHREAA